MSEVRIPADLWRDDIEGAVSVWFVEDGDVVAAGDVLCEVMAEKATYEITAPSGGTVTLLVEPETPVWRGEAIARVAG